MIKGQLGAQISSDVHTLSGRALLQCWAYSATQQHGKYPCHHHHSAGGKATHYKQYIGYIQELLSNEAIMNEWDFR